MQRPRANPAKGRHCMFMPPEPRRDPSGGGEAPEAGEQVGVPGVRPARPNARQRGKQRMVRQQYRLPGELGDARLDPGCLRRVEEGERMRLERVVGVQPGVHRHELPTPVLAAQAKIAGALPRCALVQPGDQPVIAAASAIHVVVAGQRIHRRTRASGAKYGVDRPGEVAVALGGRARVVDVAEVDQNIRPLLREVLQNGRPVPQSLSSATRASEAISITSGPAVSGRIYGMLRRRPSGPK